MKLFEDCAERDKRRKVDDLLKNRSPEELSFAIQSSLIQPGKRDTADIVRKLSEASPQRAKNLKNLVLLQGRRKVYRTLKKL